MNGEAGGGCRTEPGRRQYAAPTREERDSRRVCSEQVSRRPVGHAACIAAWDNGLRPRGVVSVVIARRGAARVGLLFRGLRARSGARSAASRSALRFGTGAHGDSTRGDDAAARIPPAIVGAAVVGCVAMRFSSHLVVLPVQMTAVCARAADNAAAQSTAVHARAARDMAGRSRAARSRAARHMAAPSLAAPSERPGPGSRESGQRLEGEV
jgi:hypothetical protein